MASFGAQNSNRYLGLVKNATRFETGLGACLPESYKKFWREWKIMKPAAVHYIPEEGRFKRDEVTGLVNPVQNVPIPLRFPKEFDEGLWGGEGVVQGFYKKGKYKRRVPHYWVPVLKRNVVRSEVLNVYLSAVVTERTMRLIHDNYGFDHYLLKTPACDLRSTLALSLKRKILQALQDNCPAYKDMPEKQAEILEEYKKYLEAYTPEDIEWYGLTWKEAIYKIALKKKLESIPVPLKQQYRSQLIEQLKQAQISEAQNADSGKQLGWMSKINPFGKKHET